MKKFLIGFGMVILCLTAYSMIKMFPKTTCFYDVCIALPYQYVGEYLSESGVVNVPEIQEIGIYNHAKFSDNPNQEMLITFAKCDIDVEGIVSARDFFNEQARIEEENSQAGQIPITGLGLPTIVELKDPHPSIESSNLIELDGTETTRCNDYRLRPNRSDQRIFMFVANHTLYELVYSPSLFSVGLSEKILTSTTVK